MSKRFSFGNMDENENYDDIIMRISTKSLGKKASINDAIIVPMKTRPFWKRYFTDCFKSKKKEKERKLK